METQAQADHVDQGLFTQVRDFLLRQLPADEALFTPGARFREDLGADSLDMAELAIAFGDEFGVEIPAAMDEKLVTIADLVSFLEDQLGTR